MHQNGIRNALNHFRELKPNDPVGLQDASRELLNLLGYASERTLPGEASDIMGTHVHDGYKDTPKEVADCWQQVRLVFQITNEEITPLLPGPAESPRFDGGNHSSFLFIAARLKDGHYSRTEYARFTREINKRFPIPSVAIFQNRDLLTIAFINRRTNKANTDRDVLEKVHLIKDINLQNPHRAHSGHPRPTLPAQVHRTNSQGKARPKL